MIDNIENRMNALLNSRVSRRTVLRGAAVTAGAYAANEAGLLVPAQAEASQWGPTANVQTEFGSINGFPKVAELPANPGKLNFTSANERLFAAFLDMGMRDIRTTAGGERLAKFVPDGTTPFPYNPEQNYTIGQVEKDASVEFTKYMPGTLKEFHGFRLTAGEFKMSLFSVGAAGQDTAIEAIQRDVIPGVGDKNPQDVTLIGFMGEDPGYALENLRPERNTFSEFVAKESKYNPRQLVEQTQQAGGSGYKEMVFFHAPTGAWLWSRIMIGEKGSETRNNLNFKDLQVMGTNIAG